MPPVSDAPGTPSARNRRFDWWQALVRVLSSIEAGATGYLLKDTYTVDFVSAIRDVRAGQSPISPTLARYLLASGDGSLLDQAVPGVRLLKRLDALLRELHGQPRIGAEQACEPALSVSGPGANQQIRMEPRGRRLL